MGRFSWWKKILAVVLLVAAIVPPISLFEWACDLYHGWAKDHPDSGFAKWLFYSVAWIHNLMGRQDRAAEVYGDFYETYKATTPGEIPDEDDRVPRARFRQAMAWYDRNQKSPETVENAHKYFTYFIEKYQDTEMVPEADLEKAIGDREACVNSGIVSPLALRKMSYPPEYSDAYEP